MTKCTNDTTVVGCLLRADGSKESVSIHYKFGTDLNGDKVLIDTSLSTPSGDAAVSYDPLVDVLSSGPCSCSVDIAEQKVDYQVDKDVPAGLESYTITNLSETDDLVLPNGYIVKPCMSVSHAASVANCKQGTLPGVTISGDTWQWTGIAPLETSS